MTYHGAKMSVMQLVAGPSRLPFQHLALRLDARAPACSAEACRCLHSAGKATFAARRALRIDRQDPPSYRRLNSSVSTTSALDLPVDGARRRVGAEAKEEGRSEEEQRAYDRLRPIIDALPGPVDWAVAYGSGVRHQANTDLTGPPPMTDFLLSTPDLAQFHTANLRQNPSHYPLTARLLGGGRIAWLTDRWGAGVWYVTMVKIRGLEVKYGVISTERLKRDLEGWETLYAAGRLHKPVLPLITPPEISESLRTNLHSALTLSLLLLPPTFTEQALWTQIAGISYAGDPRMSVPGAEHPDKVANIVKGKGALEGMRGLYGQFMGRGELALVWDRGEKRVEEPEVGKGWTWRGTGEEVLRQPDTSDHLASLIMSLPCNLRTRILRTYHAETDPGIVRTNTVEGTPSSASPERNLLLDIVGRKAISEAESAKGQVGDWRKVVLTEVANIIRRPALTQSFKGLFTAGFRKSFVYAMAKFRKWLNARRAKGGKAA